MSHYNKLSVLLLALVFVSLPVVPVSAVAATLTEAQLALLPVNVVAAIRAVQAAVPGTPEALDRKSVV